MKQFMYDGREVVCFCELVEVMGLPRGTLSDFVRRKIIKSIGKMGHKIIIACDDLREFLVSDFYKAYLRKHPKIKRYTLPIKEEAEKTDSHNPFPLESRINEINIEFKKGKLFEKNQLTVKMSLDFDSIGELERLLSYFEKKESL